MSSPPGKEHTQAPLLWDPPRLFLIRESSEMPNAHQAELDVRVCASVCWCSVGRRRLTPDFPPRLCLSRLLPTPSVMPTCGSSASPPPTTVSALSLAVQTHLLLPAAELQPPRACLLLRLMNRQQPHWLLKRKGGVERRRRRSRGGGGQALISGLSGS